jgi:hypothetical protein
MWLGDVKVGFGGATMGDCVSTAEILVKFARKPATALEYNPLFE